MTIVYGECGDDSSRDCGGSDCGICDGGGVSDCGDNGGDVDVKVAIGRGCRKGMWRACVSTSNGVEG